MVAVDLGGWSGAVGGVGGSIVGIGSAAFGMRRSAEPAKIAATRARRDR